MDSQDRCTRVPIGGIFNLPRVQYSNETRDLLKAMMEECHLSMLKRREVTRCLEAGEPLPPLRSSTDPPQRNSEVLAAHPQSVCRRRTREDIIAMGAYERDRFLADHRGCAEEEKRRLQSLMAYGTEAPHDTDRPARRSSSSSRARRLAEMERDRFQELASEAQERCDFLRAMTAFGQGCLHRRTVQAEVASKLRAMKLLDPLRFEQARQQAALPCVPPTPNTNKRRPGTARHPVLS